MNILFWEKDKLGFELLGRDANYGKIPDRERQEWIDFAWEKGRKTAEYILEKYEGLSIREILSDCHIKIVEKNNGARQIFSEYYQNSRQIILNNNSITEHFIKENEAILKTTSLKPVQDYFLAHEFFHYLECHDPTVGITFKERKIVLFQWRNIKYSVGVRALSEIAAHSFVRHFFKISDLVSIQDGVE